MEVLEVNNLKKIYTTRFGGNKVEALHDINFSVEQGEYVAIMGESGSGKTTLLNILAAVDRPTSGDIFLNGKNTTAIKDDMLAKFRREHLGFVFQDFNLLDTFSIEDNIYLPLVLAGKEYKDMKQELDVIAGKLGISHILHKYPYEVSGGQKQRTAVARAIITKPDILLADEPTGNLDPENSWEIMKLLDKVNRQGTTVIVVTHNMEIVEKMNKRVITMKKGVKVSDSKVVE